ncbi:MAG: STAS domain-containing protein [Verrucomicrobiae bacterium]|nr:STAS domain-containing protein [Verrucomicrobiae bacterium]
MKIQERDLAGIPVLDLSGEVDLQSSPELRATLQARVKAKCPVLLLNFEGVTYLDSSGLATLIEYYQNSRPFGGKFILYGLPPRIQNVFEIARLEQIFSIHPDEASALAELRP